MDQLYPDRSLTGLADKLRIRLAEAPERYLQERSPSARAEYRHALRPFTDLVMHGKELLDQSG